MTDLDARVAAAKYQQWHKDFRREAGRLPTPYEAWHAAQAELQKPALHEPVTDAEMELAELGFETTGLRATIERVLQGRAKPDVEPVAWTPGPNEFKDWCSRWFGPDSDDDYLAKAVFNLPLMAQRFENMPLIAEPATESVKLLRVLAKELDDELHGGAKWTKTQHTCNSVSGALLDIARKLEVAECENCKQLSRALAEEINGPTFMGEPVLPQKPCPAPSQPAAPVELPVVGDTALLQHALKLADRLPDSEIAYTLRLHLNGLMELPDCSSDAANAAIDKELALRNYPANSANAGRAGWEAARKFNLSNAQEAIAAGRKAS